MSIICTVWWNVAYSVSGSICEAFRHMAYCYMWVSSVCACIYMYMSIKVCMWCPTNILSYPILHQKTRHLLTTTSWTWDVTKAALSLPLLWCDWLRDRVRDRVRESCGARLDNYQLAEHQERLLWPDGEMYEPAADLLRCDLLRCDVRAEAEDKEREINASRSHSQGWAKASSSSPNATTGETRWVEMGLTHHQY